MTHLGIFQAGTTFIFIFRMVNTAVFVTAGIELMVSNTLQSVKHLLLVSREQLAVTWWKLLSRIA